MISKKIYEFIGGIFIILLPFQDVFLQNTPLGYLGANLSFLMIPFMLLIFFFNIIKAKKIRRNDFILLLALLLLLLFSSFNYFVNVSFKNDQTRVIEGVKLIIICFFSIFPIVYFSQNKMDNLKPFLTIALLIVILGVLVSDYLSLEFIGILHQQEYWNSRPRGFSTESSLLGATVGIIIALYFSTVTWRSNHIFTIIIFVAIFFTGSKGAIFSMFLSYGLLELRRMKLNINTLIVIILGTLSFIFIVAQAINTLMIDIEKYTSFATRTSLIIASINSAINNPFGLGFWGYYGQGKVYILQALELTKSNTREIETIVRTGVNYSFKTGLGDALVIGGIPIVVFCLCKLKKMSKQCDNYYLKLSMLFSIISLSTYVSFLGFYVITLPFIFVLQDIKFKDIK